MQDPLNALGRKYSRARHWASPRQGNAATRSYAPQPGRIPAGGFRWIRGVLFSTSDPRILRVKGHRGRGTCQSATRRIRTSVKLRSKTQKVYELGVRDHKDGSISDVNLRLFE